MMNNEQIDISGFPKHIFWSYEKDAKLSKSIVIEHVILYGELNDYKKLLDLVSKSDIKEVTERIEKSGRFKKRINFVNKVILS